MKTLNRERLKARRRPRVWSALLRVSLLALLPPTTWAGPPFVTDDPVPVEVRHWEVYLASQVAQDESGWSGTAPHLEVNYGAAPELMVHLIAPAAFSAPGHGPTAYGYGDTELGVKYRLLQETPTLPQVGTFELAELPTGNYNQGLGSGLPRYFIPLWLQKSFGSLTTYGGGGYWINPGTGQQNYWLFGWHAEYQLLKNLALGGEIVYATPAASGDDSAKVFNLGGIFDLSDQYHLLLSAGRDFQKPNSLQIYFACQWTSGP